MYEIFVPDRSMVPLVCLNWCTYGTMLLSLNVHALTFLQFSLIEIFPNGGGAGGGSPLIYPWVVLNGYTLRGIDFSQQLLYLFLQQISALHE